MTSIPLDIIGAITGIIGTFTGVVSLVWLIWKNKPKLRLEGAYFEWKNKIEKVNLDRDFVSVKIVLRNLSTRSTTIEDLYVTIGNTAIIPKSFDAVTISGSRSKPLEYLFNFDKKEFKKLFDENGNIELGVLIIHTFGAINKKEKATLRTGYFNLR